MCNEETIQGRQGAQLQDLVELGQVGGVSGEGQRTEMSGEEGPASLFLPFISTSPPDHSWQQVSLAWELTLSVLCPLLSLPCLGSVAPRPMQGPFPAMLFAGPSSG